MIARVIAHFGKLVQTRPQRAVWAGQSIRAGVSTYPAHSVCRLQRHTECAGYIVACILLAFFLFQPTGTAGAGLDFTIGERGLTSLSYDGFDLVPKTIWHGVRGYAVQQLPKDGSKFSDKDEYSSSALVDGGRAIAFTFPWGRVTIKYVKVSPRRLDSRLHRGQFASEPASCPAAHWKFRGCPQGQILFGRNRLERMGRRHGQLSAGQPGSAGR